MTEIEARTALSNYLQGISGDTNHRPPPEWSDQTPKAEQRDDGTWVFSFSETEGVVIRPQYPPIPFWRALGKAVPHLGLPRSRELFLCSTVHGRYQVYENGIAVWEAGPDIGFPVPTHAKEVQEGQGCRAIVGFFDLRGFTSWSSQKGRTAAEIQEVVRLLEDEFQEAFSKAWCHRLFTKGTGDGFMVVSEAGWAQELANGDRALQAGHAALFAVACATLIVKTRPRLPPELALGCGITLGEITRIFLLGRHDYIGSPVNEAAKIQQIGWDELCVNQAFLDAMKADGLNVNPYRLAGKAWRVAPNDCLVACNSHVGHRGDAKEDS